MSEPTFAQLMDLRDVLHHAWMHIQDGDETAVGPILSKNGLSFYVSLPGGIRCYDLQIDWSGNLMIVRGPGDSALISPSGHLIQL